MKIIRKKRDASFRIYKSAFHPFIERDLPLKPCFRCVSKSCEIGCACHVFADPDQPQDRSPQYWEPLFGWASI